MSGLYNNFVVVNAVSFLAALVFNKIIIGGINIIITDILLEL